MRCEEVQDLASAWLDNELSEARAGMVAEHEAGCDACRAYITDLRILAEQMTQLGREPAPPGLEERIRLVLAEEPSRPVVPIAQIRRFPSLATVRWLTSMAAVCLLSVFGTWSVVRQPDAVVTTQHDVVAAHVRSLLQNSTIQVPSSDSHTVRPWFAGKVEFAPPVKDLTAEGFPLVGGRLDYVDGHRVATLVYHHGLHTISVFVWPETSGSAMSRAPAQVEGQGGGLNVLSWSKDGMVWWAVSDMEMGELKELRSLL
jgi:anti-sigma factor RsiW